MGRGSSNNLGILLAALHWISRLLSVICRHEEWGSQEDMERDPESYHSDVQYGRDVGVPNQAGGGWLMHLVGDATGEFRHDSSLEMKYFSLPDSWMVEWRGTGTCREIHRLLGVRKDVHVSVSFD